MYGERSSAAGLLLFLMAQGACADPVIDALPYACEATAECGPGFVCFASRCVRDADAASDATTTTATGDATSADGDSAAPACNPEERRCAPDRPNVPELCGETGQWQAGPPCTWLCADGACTGSCEPGTSGCLGATVVTCDDSGAPVTGETCADNCVDGACVGACTTGERTCAGVDLLRECVDGHFQDLETCPNVCLDDACGGACKPGDARCEDGVPATCDASGAWQPGDPCTFACAGEPGCPGCVSDPVEVACADRCGTVRDDCDRDVACADTCADTAGFVCGGAVDGVCGCVPDTVICHGATPATCDDSGAWVDAPAPCPGTCRDGACAPACSGDERDCNGQVPRRCGDDGLWVDETSCAQSDTSCVAGACVGDCTTSDRRCATDAAHTPEICDALGAWERAPACVDQACVDGACVGECTPGAHRCRPSEAAFATVLERCDDAGAWVADTTCDYVCRDAPTPACAGECLPSAEPRCDDDVVERCVDYTWTATDTCPNGCAQGLCCQSDVSVCSGDLGAPCLTTVIKDCGLPVTCDASCDQGLSCGATEVNRCGCLPGQRRCVGDVPELCVAGQWQAEAECSGELTCISSLGACGVCEPGTGRCVGNTAELCGANGRWPPDGGFQTSCDATNQWCNGGQCQGVCKPGDITCISFAEYVPCVGGNYLGATGNCGSIDASYLCNDVDPDYCGCYDGERRCGGDGDSIEVCQGGRWQLTATCTGAEQTCCEACGALCRTALQCDICENR